MPGGCPLPAQLSPPSDQVDEVLQRPRRAPFLPAGPTRKGRVRWWPGGKGAEVACVGRVLMVPHPQRDYPQL